MQNSLEILVVDHDRDVAEGLADVLDLSGHKVHLAVDVGKAADIFRQYDFDICFINVKMPGLSGVESFAQFRKLKPSARVVMLTGHTLDQLVAQAAESSPVKVLRTPITTESVVNALGDVKPEGIVVVDETTPEFRQDLHAALVEKGLRVCLAKSDAEALDTIQSGSHDVLVLDFQLTVIRALEIYLELKQRGRSLRTVAYNRHVDSAGQGTHGEADFLVSGVFFKPFDPGQMLKTLENLSAASQPIPSGHDPEAVAAPVAPPQPDESAQPAAPAAPSVDQVLEDWISDASPPDWPDHDSIAPGLENGMRQPDAAATNIDTLPVSADSRDGAEMPRDTGLDTRLDPAPAEADLVRTPDLAEGDVLLGAPQAEPAPAEPPQPAAAPEPPLAAEPIVEQTWADDIPDQAVALGPNEAFEGVDGQLDAPTQPDAIYDEAIPVSDWQPDPAPAPGSSDGPDAALGQGDVMLGVPASSAPAPQSPEPEVLAGDPPGACDPLPVESPEESPVADLEQPDRAPEGPRSGPSDDYEPGPTRIHDVNPQTLANTLRDIGSDTGETRVLVVDDDRDMAEGLAEILQDCGLTVRVAHTQEKAIEVVKEFDAQIALIDIQLGRNSGLELIATLKEHRPSLIAVMVTAKTDQQSAITALRKGAFDYLNKPLHPQELLEALDRCFEKLREQPEFAEVIAEAKQELEETEEPTPEFLANLSHKLRTPLNAVVGFSEILSEEMLGPLGSEQYLNYAHDINEAGKVLMSAIEQFTGIDKSESGKVELNEEDVDLTRIIFYCLRRIQPAVDAGNLTIDIEIAEIPVFLQGDRHKLTQVVLSLLTNAVKFTPQKGQIHFILYRDNSDDLIIQVRDTGVGIAEEEITKALSSVIKGDGDLHPDYEGSGLGLPLATSMVEMHGGELSLDSTVGVGTLATVRLPSGRKIEPQHAAAV